MKSLDLGLMPMPVNGTQYYLREVRSESSVTNTSAHFKFTAGLMSDLKVTGKLNIMPYFGVGGLTMSRRNYEILLKEAGSNMQYNTKYVWGKDSGEVQVQTY